MADAAGEDRIVDEVFAGDAAEDRLVRRRPREGEAHRAAAGIGDGVERTAVRLGLAHQAQGCGVARMQEDVGHRPLLHHAAAIEHGDAIAGAADDVHLMGDEHDGDAEVAVDLAQEIEHRACCLRVERAGRLVAEQDRGFAGERPCNADALLLPAGKLARIFLRMFRQADAGEQRGDALGDLDPAVVTGQLQRIGDIAGDGAGAQEIEMLEDHAD